VHTGINTNMHVSSHSKADAAEQRDMVNSGSGAGGTKDWNLGLRTEVGCTGSGTSTSYIKYYSIVPIVYYLPCRYHIYPSIHT
jgi:hypothetical protein